MPIEISDLARSYSGAPSVDVVERANDVRRQVGVAFGGERGRYDRLSASDNLRFAAQLYGVSPRSAKIRVAELLELVGLADKTNVRVEAFSRGMKQRLLLQLGGLR